MSKQTGKTQLVFYGLFEILKCFWLGFGQLKGTKLIQLKKDKQRDRL